MFPEDIWICNSGACGHYCNSTIGVFNIEEISKSSTVGNGKSMTASQFGSLKCCIIQVDGSGLETTLNEVKHVLFNKALKKRYKLGVKGYPFVYQRAI
jgi:hypothetical protein